ncbi:hypothetical protein PAMC26577_26365 [Caballeronia sordidicola]|uniref:Uncharacterized protein n=1 Tax=Caballeronia sordidicola TaxID=196367 RepID=A0A242MH04_CABSO|nr:hypothetical protein PAMC26577_26365 [Caballeronia sordidicola]
MDLWRRLRDRRGRLPTHRKHTVGYPAGKPTRSAMLIHSCRIDISISNLLGSQAPFKGLS